MKAAPVFQGGRKGLFQAFRPSFFVEQQQESPVAHRQEPDFDRGRQKGMELAEDGGGRQGEDGGQEPAGEKKDGGGLYNHGPGVPGKIHVPSQGD